MSTDKPNLDLVTAKRIARGQLEVISISFSERIARLPTQLPAKRTAWVREIEKFYREAYKDTLIAIDSEKRRVVAVYFMPLADQYDGWLSIETSMASFGGGRSKIQLAVITEHTITRVMEGLRSTNLIEGLRGELSEWMIIGLMNFVNSQTKPECLYIATKSGYFIAKWDITHNTFVFTGWHTERLATDKERFILAKLRRDEVLGIGATLTDCV